LEEDLRHWLDIIAARARASRVSWRRMRGSQRLPQPTLAPALLAPLITRVAALESHFAVKSSADRRHADVRRSAG